MNREIYIIVTTGLVVLYIIQKQTKVFSYINDNINNSSSVKTKYKQQSFNHFNPHENTWCPSAKCFNSPLCLPCNQRFLFILATGRSGSTTLLSMFNQLPNVRLSGESYNIVFKASELLKTIEENPTEFINNETMNEGYFMGETIESGAFMHNAIPIGSFACVIQHLHQTLNPPPIIVHENTNQTTMINQEDEENNKILGMKEIRLQDQDLIPWDVKEAAKFLKENFPCSRYIININSQFIHQSKAMKQFLKHKTDGLNRIQVQEKIKSENAFLTDLSEILGNNTAKLIDLVAWKEDVSILNQIVDWLGYENCAFNTLIHENNAGYALDNKTKLNLGLHCKYPY